ncbi:MAG: universal stress protein [Planctomycetota bacterium]|nr:universal stress protein [Planctomycetota bacterium]
MMRSILVALDESPAAARAVDLALRWGARFDASVRGIGVLAEDAVDPPEAVPIGGEAFRRERAETDLEQMERDLDALIDSFGDRCRELGVRCETCRRRGDFAGELVAEARAHDVTILAREPTFGIDKGSPPARRLTHLLENSPRPVIVTSPEQTNGEGVLIACDGSFQSARAIGACIALGLQRLSPLELLCVDRDSREEAERCAEPALRYLGSHGADAKLNAIITDDPIDEVILDRAREMEAQLIVMGAYGRPRVLEFFLGSVTQRMIETSPIPLLLSH